MEGCKNGIRSEGVRTLGIISTSVAKEVIPAKSQVRKKQETRRKRNAGGKRINKSGEKIIILCKVSWISIDVGFSYDSERLDTPLYGNDHLLLVGFSQEYLAAWSSRREYVYYERSKSG